MTGFTRYNGHPRRKTGQHLGRLRCMALSRPTASRIIIALEKQVGAVLPTRTTRTVTLTEANHGARDMGELVASFELH